MTVAQELDQYHLPPTSPVLFQNFSLSTLTYFLDVCGRHYLHRNRFAPWEDEPHYGRSPQITFSYTIGAHLLWEGGSLFQIGMIDYSVGYVSHASSGTAAFVALWGAVEGNGKQVWLQ